jgi:hypothetical protein
VAAQVAGPARPPYIGAMRGLPPVHGPRTVYRDLKAFMGRRSREKNIAALLSIGLTGAIVLIFMLDLETNIEPPPTITYVDSWSLDRTDAEIMVAQRKYMAEREAKSKARQQEFQEIANTLGIE